MKSYRRLWILSATLSSLLLSIFCLGVIKDLRTAEQSVEKTGKVRLVSIDTKHRSRQNLTRHRANLLFITESWEAELFKFPNESYESRDHKELMDQVSALTKQTTITVSCSISHRTCFAHAAVATSKKIAMITALLGCAVFFILAFNATKAKQLIATQ